MRPASIERWWLAETEIQGNDRRRRLLVAGVSVRFIALPCPQAPAECLESAGVDGEIRASTGVRRFLPHDSDPRRPRLGADDGPDHVDARR